MKKAAGVLVVAVVVMMCGGCSKSEEKFDLGKETAKIEVQVPTLEPTPTLMAEKTDEPTTTTRVPSTPAVSNNAKDKSSEQPKESETETKMEDYFTISLPENAEIAYKEEEFTATIEQQGKRVANIKLISEYPGKVGIQQVVEEQLEEEGYLKEVRTYDKGDYNMVKAQVSTGISKEDVEHGKLVGGGEEAHYIYYRNTAPTSLMILSFKDDSIENSEQDRIAKSVVLNK